MKKQFIIALTFALIISNGLQAQNKFSIGLVGTRFENVGIENDFTQVKAPVGYGLILGYSLNKDISVALTGEYYNSQMDKISGNEKDFRGHLSVFLTPFPFETIRPYLSGGIVYTNRTYTYSTSNLEESKNLFNGRIGMGIDYSLIQNVFLNVDLGLYNDGLSIVGWSSSIGLRVSPKFF